MESSEEHYLVKLQPKSENWAELAVRRPMTPIRPAGLKLKSPTLSKKQQMFLNNLSSKFEKPQKMVSLSRNSSLANKSLMQISEQKFFKKYPA